MLDVGLVILSHEGSKPDQAVAHRCRHFEFNCQLALPLDRVDLPFDSLIVFSLDERDVKLLCTQLSRTTGLARSMNLNNQ